MAMSRFRPEMYLDQGSLHTELVQYRSRHGRRKEVLVSSDGFIYTKVRRTENSAVFIHVWTGAGRHVDHSTVVVYEFS